MGKLLEGRVAVVTGAGNGIGRAEAIGLAAQGARVVVNDIGTSYDGRGTGGSYTPDPDQRPVPGRFPGSVETGISILWRWRIGGKNG